MMNHWNLLENRYYSDLLLQGRQKETINTYKNHLGRFVSKLSGIIPEHCTGSDVQYACREAMREYRSSYQGYGSRRLFVAVVRAFLRWCMTNAAVPLMALTHYVARCHGRETCTVPIKLIEIEQLLRTIQTSSSLTRKRDAALFAIYAYTGVRRSEALALKVYDFDSDSSEIRIQSKGGIYKRKPVIRKLLVILKHYCSWLINNTGRSCCDSASFLFPGRGACGHLSSRQVNNIFNKWKQKAALRRDLNINSFRAGLLQ